VGLDVNEHKGDRTAALYTKGEWYLLDTSGNRKKLIYNPANDNIRKEDITYVKKRYRIISRLPDLKYIFISVPVISDDE